MNKQQRKFSNTKGWFFEVAASKQNKEITEKPLKN